MWLLERLTPDFKTIADFRKDNGEGIRNACRAFIGLCRQMKMFTDVVVAIDGSKFKAVNSKPNNFTSQKDKDHIERVEQSITFYLNKLDEADKNTEPDANTKLTATKLAWLKKRLRELQEIQQAIAQQPDKQLSLTDPDYRLMKTNNMNWQVCYNVQTAVDTKNHLIVAHEVTDCAGLTNRYRPWESEILKGLSDGFKLRIFESLRDMWGSLRHRTNMTPNLTTKFSRCGGETKNASGRFFTLTC